MKTRINELKSTPQGRAFLVTALVFIVTLLTAVPVFAAVQIDDFSQCANGPAGTLPPVCSGGITTNTWIFGNLNASNSQYQPGQVVPQRIALSGLTVGQTYSLTLSFQAGAGIVAGNQGTHAYDYFATFSETVTTADPCDNGAKTPFCSGAATSHLTINTDPSNKLSCGFTATQHSGQWTAWGANLTGMSAYLYNSAKDATSGTNELSGSGCLITNTNSYIGTVLTFIATNTNPVIAYGLHISYDQEWGLNNAAPSISGASYHSILADCSSQFVGCGLRDNQMQLSATPTAVTLSKFGVLEVVPAHTTLQWTTASEVNTAGFNVYRSENQNGPFIRVNPQLIPASADSLVGGKYEYQDNSVSYGKTYYYQLEDVEYNGTSTRHPAVAVTMAAMPGLGNAGGALIGLGVGTLAVAIAGLLILRKKSA